jgi:hypothetical protein
MRQLCLVAALGLAAGASRGEDLESSRIEVTAALWPLEASGVIQSGGTAIDLERDLGLAGRKTHFLGRLAVKPSRRHRLLLEGIGYRLSADTVLERQLEYAGQVYNVRQPVSSRAEVTSVFGGYQFDLVSRERGHGGIQAGAAYFDATGTITATGGAVGGSVSARERVGHPLPLVGGGFRAWLNRRVNVNGEARGISLGKYGHYLQATGQVGVRLGRHVVVQAGYSLLDGDLHKEDRTVRVQPRFRGPVLSVQFRDR